MTLNVVGKAARWIKGYVTLIDGTTGKEAAVETNGGLAVNIQDQTSRSFSLYFSQDVGAQTTLTTDAVKDAYSISVTTGHGLVAGDDFILRDPVNQKGYTGGVVSVAGANTVNVDRPLDFAYPSASTQVQERAYDLNVDGSGTRQTFSIGGSLTAQLDVTRFIFQMTCTDAPTFGLFGDQTALTRGCVMRKNNGETYNLWNVKTNGDLANLMYDVSFYSSAHPLAVNGVAGRLTYGGPSKHGVVLRLGANESLEFIVQDDIDALLSFKLIAQGHIVTD